MNIKIYAETLSVGSFDVDYIELMDKNGNAYTVEDENIDVYGENGQTVVTGRGEWRVNPALLRLSAVQLFLRGSSREVLVDASCQSREKRGGMLVCPITDELFHVTEYYVESGLFSVQRVVSECCTA